ncbi:helix-turn-helix domain-containing protein [Methylocystis sp. WRRC1]|uniref:GlxA family transcriptional regulator n=1 Tax=Methylocystis sp. WRRC1 TaxID=1732014 RepID=UPI001D147F12|nr:helix-turn-helix domain-containing protein [Methylocystis sp. WRRC1]MCC3243769.1 helix-turn-helix domain-containing protein [Methylocystis sp. WRRC1]
MHKIVVAGLDGCLGSAFLGLTDLLTLARRAIGGALPPSDQDSGGGDADFCVVTASATGRPVRDGAGATFEVETSFEEVTTCDAVIVPSFAPDPNGKPPDMSAHAAAAAWLRRHHSRGALIGGCGSGVFLLGEAGLLEGRRCTTSRWHHEELKQRYPRADTAWGARLIDDRRVVTAAGPLSWIDVALHVIRTLCGPDAGRIAADFTLGESAPAKGGIRGAAYNVSVLGDSSDSFLSEAERIVRQSDAAFNAQDLARALSTSERTLHRRLKQACGESPKTFIDRIRVETARMLLETSVKPVKELAASAGFIDEASFRRAFRRFTDMAPSAYRVWAKSKSQDKAQMFSVRKDSEIIPEILTTILDTCVNGVTLTDPDLEDAPIVYANKRFEDITGYSVAEIIGRNCRFLQGQDRDQEGLRRLREAISNRQAIEVTLRNYRKDGALFHNKLNITPLFDAQGQLIYFLGVQYDVTDQIRAETEIGDLKAKLHSLA